MSFGIYVHIPYCKQLCPYCDFTRYSIDKMSKILPPAKYIDLLKKEIKARAKTIGPRSIQTIYFGGGTPSLVEPELIVSVIEELANHGFNIQENAELSIEIDPGTIDEKKLDALIAGGFNRFSVGAQTFSDRLLKVAGRKHSRDDTITLLKMMSQKGLNYSFDLLFALPTQTLSDLEQDLEMALLFQPSHLSAYCLNVAENHPMNQARPMDEVQVEMFALIERILAQKKLYRYEISNFAKPGFESQHNLHYWNDTEYWGLGVSAHSYLKMGAWGQRFSNPKRIRNYEKQIEDWDSQADAIWSFQKHLSPEDFEELEAHQSLTDYCHTSLRLTRGLHPQSLLQKFSPKLAGLVELRLKDLEQNELVQHLDDYWQLTEQGKMLANLVFEKLTFSREELLNYLPPQVDKCPTQPIMK
jgi:oxygen-independent coproporphyrinogen-3 oxidase